MSRLMTCLLKGTCCLGAALILSCVSACGGGDTTPSSGGSSAPITSSSISLPTSVQVISAH